MNMRANYLMFSSFPQGTDRKTVHSVFNPFGKIKKLYIHPADFSGKVYFDSKEIVEEAFNALNGAPPYFLKLTAHVNVNCSFLNNNSADDEISSTETNKMYYVEDDDDDVMADIGPVLVNVNGITVSTLSTDDGEIYVPLSEIKNIGFELFESHLIPKRLDYDEQTLREFELYLSMKTKKFMIQRNYKIPERVVEQVKQRMVTQVFGSRHQSKSDLSHIAVPKGKKGFPPSDNACKLNDKSSNQLGDRQQNKKLNEQTTENQPLRKPHGTKHGDQNRFSKDNSNSSERKPPSSSIAKNNFQSRQNSEQNVPNNFAKNLNFGRNEANKAETKISSVQQNIIKNGENMPAIERKSEDSGESKITAVGNKYELMPKDSVEHAPALKKSHPLYNQIDLVLNSLQEVEIAHVESKKKCWVYLQKNKNIVEDLLMQTNIEADTISAGEPEVGKICAAMFSDAWYRAIVLNKQPALKVLYIDFGNKNTERLREIRDLPDSITTVPGQAVCISFDDPPKAPLDVGLQMKIIPSKKLSNGTYIVSEEKIVSPLLKSINAKPSGAQFITSNTEIPKGNAVESATSKVISVNIHNSSGAIKKSTVFNNSQDKDGMKKLPEKVIQKENLHSEMKETRPLVIDSVGSKAQLDCIEIVNDTTFVGFICPEANIEEINTLEEIKDEVKPDKDFIAKIGDMVAVSYDEGWVRGIIINIKNNEFTTALIDYGTVIVANEVCCLSKRFVDIPEFSCVCVCKPDSMELIKKFQQGMQCTIVEANKLKLDFTNGISCFVRCEKWDPFLTSTMAAKTLHQEDVTPIFTTPPALKNIKPNDIVIIVGLNTEGKLLVRTKAYNTLFKEITQDILKFESHPLKSLPVIHQIVLSPYKSGRELYRAIVTSTNNEEADVYFTDYGYEDTVPLANLRTIGENLATKDSTLIPVTLRKFENKELNMAALELLKMHADQKDKFRVETTSNVGVYDLLDVKENSLAEKLSSMDATDSHSPGSRASSRASTITYQKMAEPNVPLGPNELMCINVENLDEGKLTFISCEVEITNMLVDLSDKFVEYVKMHTKPHSPKINDICLALFEDAWYRAKVNTADINEDKYDVYYIDFGNSSTVSSAEIRKIPEKFAQLAPLALNCVLQDIADRKVTGHLLNRLQELILINETYSVSVMSNENKTYNINIPAVMKTLKQEKLL